MIGHLWPQAPGPRPSPLKAEIEKPHKRFLNPEKPVFASLYLSVPGYAQFTLTHTNCMENVCLACPSGPDALLYCHSTTPLSATLSFTMRKAGKQTENGHMWRMGQSFMGFLFQMGCLAILTLQAFLCNYALPKFWRHIRKITLTRWEEAVCIHITDKW